VSDLDTIARRAGAAARTEAATRARRLAFQLDPSASTGARRRVVALAAAAVALTAAIAVVVAQLTSGPGLVIEPVGPDTSDDPPSSSSDAPGRFVSVGSLQMSCAWCSATLLDDGRVLVVGTGAELYDPTTATFTPTGGPLAVDVSGRASAPLADGRVLIVGTGGSTAKLYDPATEMFTAVPGRFDPVLDAINGPRAGEHSATPVVLADGRVLLVGATAAAMFDPDTGELGPTASMAEVRNIAATATLLDDGRVLVAGGVVAGAPSAEVYDPASGTFGPAGDTALAPSYATATRLGDGRVLLVGGELEEAAILFDPASESFTPTGSMATARSMHAAALLPDGRVLVVGGFGSSGDRTVARTAEIYDPDTGRFTPAPAPTGDRRAATAITLDNGDVLVLGNYPGNGGMWPDTDAPTAEIFSLEGFEPPPGCCPEAPSDLSFEATIEPSRSAALAGRSLHATVTIPPGGIEDATAASFHWTADAASDGVGEGGDHPLPTDCHTGCRHTIPISLPPETAEAEDLTVTAHLTITYSGTPPDAAEGITLRIGAD
jgi:hypothetical protein